jgi:hypothetical protein
MSSTEIPNNRKRAQLAGTTTDADGAGVRPCSPFLTRISVWGCADSLSSFGGEGQGEEVVVLG